MTRLGPANFQFAGLFCFNLPNVQGERFGKMESANHELREFVFAVRRIGLRVRALPMGEESAGQLTPFEGGHEYTVDYDGWSVALAEFIRVLSLSFNTDKLLSFLAARISATGYGSANRVGAPPVCQKQTRLGSSPCFAISNNP